MVYVINILSVVYVSIYDGINLPNMAMPWKFGKMLMYIDLIIIIIAAKLVRTREYVKLCMHRKTICNVKIISPV